MNNTSGTTIVKRHGAIQPFDPEKLRLSLTAACLAVRTPAGEAEQTAGRVYRDIAPWLSGKPEITSHDIRVHAAEALRTYNPDAAYLYKHHGIIH